MDDRVSLLSDTAEALNEGFKCMSRNYRRVCKESGNYSPGVFQRLTMARMRDLDRADKYIARSDYADFQWWLRESKIPVELATPNDVGKLLMSYLNKTEPDIAHDVWVKEKGDLE